VIALDRGKRRSHPRKVSQIALIVGQWLGGDIRPDADPPGRKLVRGNHRMAGYARLLGSSR
jgi:hypothetical protein